MTWTCWQQHTCLVAAFAVLVFPCYFLWHEQHSYLLDQYLGLHPLLSNCTFDNKDCFDWTGPCQHSTKIYIYPRSEGSWFENSFVGRLISNSDEIQKFDARVDRALRADPSLTITSDPGEACLFVPRIACLSVNQCDLPPILARTRLQHLPYWNNGLNHVLLDHGDDPFSYGTTSGVGYEIRIRSASSAKYHRKGFDIGISLRPKLSVYGHIVQGGGMHAASNRLLLLGFLGAPTTTSGLRQSLLQLHAPQDAIDIRVRPPKCPVPCLRHTQEYYDEYRSILLRSKFQLVPRGAGLHSHRLLESIAAGTVPIVLADGMTLPFHEIIPWEEAILIVPEKDWRMAPAIAREHIDNVAEMQCAGLAIYRHFFLRPYGTINLSFRLLQRRLHRLRRLRRRSATDSQTIRNQRTTLAKDPPLLPSWSFGKPVPRQPSFCATSKRAQVIEDIVEQINMNMI